MNITVILCTFNRCLSLHRALDSVVAQLLPDSVSWEVIVVDNNSSDQTHAVAEEYCRRYPSRVRYIFEPQQGLSRARNAGVRQAQGEIIVFIDDDVVAEPSWLQNLTNGLQDERWAGAGGRIAPPPEFDPPAWFTVGGPMDLFGALLPIFDLGNQAGIMKRPPYGANMAYRKGMFDKHGMFRVDLGRCGNSLVMGEDTEFGNRLMSAGESLRYEPSAVVQHPVPEERLSKDHFRRWFTDFGRTRIIERPARPPLWGISRSFISLINLTFRCLPVRTVQWLVAANTKRRFFNECQVWMTFGEIAETYRETIPSKRIAQQV